MKLSLRGLLAITIIVLPVVALLPLGLLWLWQHNAFMEWMLALVGLSGITWLLPLFLNRMNVVTPTSNPEVTPDPNWLERDRAAWDKFTVVADQLRLADYPLDDSAKLLELGRQTIECVARHYHPGSKNATIEIPIPYLLVIMERVSQDLRKLLDNIPFSHVLTIHDLIRGHGLASFASRCYKVYRLGSIAINPVTAVLRELRALATHEILRHPADELKLWLLQSYVKKVGYYSIELYSGALTLSDAHTAQYITTYSRADLAQSQERPIEEPLRLLVLGQVNAGKSSLINALFGEMRAMTDVLPLTSGITPYAVERDGAVQMIVLDSAGYAGPTEGQGRNKTQAEILHCDLVVLVCAATNAAREADRQLLEQVNALFQSRPDLVPPPSVVVLTHIDQLRPMREWEPPYNIAHPERPKELAVRQAMEATAEDLGVDVNNVIPVNARARHLYNIEEGVIPTILANLNSARRVNYLRCLRERQREEYWDHLREQAWNAGRIILDLSSRMTSKTLVKLGDEVKHRLGF